MIELNSNNYFELIQYLGSDQYTIEPFISNSIMDNIAIDPSIFIDTEIRVLKKDNNIYNLFCTKIKGKDLNGIEEFQCNALGNKIFNIINLPNYKIIDRKVLNLNNFNTMKQQYKIIVLKSMKQKYYENNLYWDWFKIV